MTKQAPTVDDLALMQIAREDSDALLARLAKKREAISKALENLDEAKRKSDSEARLEFNVHRSEHEFNAVTSALTDLGIGFTLERDQRSWGIHDLNTSYYHVVVIPIAKAQAA